MKRIILFLLLGCGLCLLPVQAQDDDDIEFAPYSYVLTCRGVRVATYLANRELTEAEMANIEHTLFLPGNAFYALGITSANIHGRMTTRYNCHGFAWHMAKKDWDNRRWITNWGEPVWIGDDVTKYFEGIYACFMECYYNDPRVEKVFYYRAWGGHSAIVLSLTPRRYLSKWGMWHLIEHYPDQVTWNYFPAHRIYFRRIPTIEGAEVITTTAVYRLSTGENAVWSISGTGFSIIGSANGSSVTVNASSAAFGRDARLTAVIQGIGDNTVTVYKPIRAINLSNVAISGPDFVCATASTFTVSNVPSGVSVAWSGSAGLTVVGNGNTASVRKTSTAFDTNLNAWVRATLSVGNNVVLTRQIPVIAWRSGAQREEVRNATFQAHIDWGEFRVTAPDGSMTMGRNFQWSTDLWGFDICCNGDPLAFWGSSWGNPPCGSFHVQVSFTDACGGWSTLLKQFDLEDCFWFFAYPNPARDVLTVTQRDAHDPRSRIAGNVELRLYNHDGQLVRRQAMGVVARQATINVSDLPAGNYVLNIVVDGQVVERQVIVIVN